MKTAFLLTLVVPILASQTSATQAQDRYPSFDEPSTLAPLPSLNQKASSQVDPYGDSETQSPYPQLSRLPSFTPPTQETNQTTSANQATDDEEFETGTTDPPKQKGNSLITNRFTFQNWTYGTNGYADYVTPGRLFIGDNNSAQTDNRLIFRYNHFNNALDSSLTNGAGTNYTQNGSIDQFLVGFEKTLDAAQQWSLELRLPLYGSSDAFFSDGFSTQNLSVGNLAAILKRQLYEDDFRVISTGLALSVPTGNDSSFIVGEEMFTVKNRATYLAPFVAGLWTPNEKWFYHAFLTVDIAASSNPIEYREILPCGCAGGLLGKMTNQTLLNVDMAAGYWWYRDRNDRFVTAISSMIEVHYVTPLNDADVVSANTPYNYVQFTSTGGNTFDSVNVTAGFDFNILNRLSYRVATIIPVQGGFDRFFDAEFQTSINFLR